MIAISVCNKVNSGWSKYIQRWWIFWSYVDTLKEGVDQHRKRECLKDAISKCKAYLLVGKQKWTHKKVDKASDESTYKTNAVYKKRELKEKYKTMEKP